MSSLRMSWRHQHSDLKKCVTRFYGVLLDEVSDMIEEDKTGRNDRAYMTE
jgi:hypothetical protein